MLREQMWGADWPEQITLDEAAEDIEFDLFNDDDPTALLVKRWIDVDGYATYTLAELEDNDAEDRTGRLTDGLMGRPQGVPPVVILDEREGLRDGYHRAALAEHFGWTQMPAYVRAGLDEERR